MSLYNKASLIQVPSLYKDGLLVSTVPEDRSGDFAVARGANLSATRIGEDGYIKKGYENLLLQSNSFDTTWTTFGTSVTSGQSGYDGSNDAWLLEKTSANGYLNQSNIDNGVQTFSIYAKANESNFLYVRIYADSPRVFFDLINGVTTNSGPVISSSIEDVGNGWYHCSFSTNMTSASFLRIYPAEAAFDSSATSGSIYIQDAQLNQGLVAYPYLETTTAPAQGGLLENTPRLDWSNGVPSVLVEEGRTNLINYSEPFEASGTPNWRVQNGTITLSDEKPYFLNTYAAKYVPTSSGLNQFFITIPSLISGSSYVNTYYLKPSSGISYLFFDVSGRIKYNVSTNLLDPLPVGVSGGITPLQDGWLKATFIYDSVSSSINTNKVYASSTDNFTSGIPLNEYLLFTACQFEQGSTPSSYIPTYGTTQTRSNETVSDTFSIPTTATIYNSFYSDVSEQVYVLDQVFNVSVGLNKVAIAFSPTAIKISVGGAIVASSTGSYDTTSLSNIQLGSNNGTDYSNAPISGFYVFPEFLTDAELNSLTD